MAGYIIGQIFFGNYPPEATLWCQKNKAKMVELSTSGPVRRFQIVAIPEPTRVEVLHARLAELQTYLTSTDWYAIRYADTSEPIPIDIKEARASARCEIDGLREELLEQGAAESQVGDDL